MFIIRKKFKFEMSHRLTSSYSKACQQLHGHSYILELFLKSDTLNEDSMVIDFGEIKDTLKDYIASWDHVLVLHSSDELIKVLKDTVKYKVVEYNPTAELMAKDMYDTIKYKFNVKNLHEIRLHETDTGYASYTEE